MRRVCIFSLALAVGASPLAEASAQAQANDAAPPGIVASGSPDVIVGGSPAARQGDPANGGSPIVEGSSNVFINGRAAALVGHRTACGGVADLLRARDRAGHPLLRSFRAPERQVAGPPARA